MWSEIMGEYFQKSRFMPLLISKSVALDPGIWQEFSDQTQGDRILLNLPNLPNGGQQYCIKPGCNSRKKRAPNRGGGLTELLLDQFSKGQVSACHGLTREALISGDLMSDAKESVPFAAISRVPGLRYSLK